jgi:hypothetical protein
MTTPIKDYIQVHVKIEVPHAIKLMELMNRLGQYYSLTEKRNGDSELGSLCQFMEFAINRSMTNKNAATKKQPVRKNRRVAPN